MTGAVAPLFRHVDAGTPESDWTSDPRWQEVAPLTHHDLQRFERLVVVAAHPDDETLGAAGLIRTAAELGLRAQVVVLTDGEASHPQSTTTTARRLAGVRRAETSAALGLLCSEADVTYAGLPDGALVAARDRAVAALVETIGESGATTLVVAPWRDDRHPDHEAAARAAQIASERTDASLLEYPIWLWHWGAPDDAPWASMRVLALDAMTQEAKAEAMAKHVSQVEPLSDAPGDEVLLHEGVLSHFRRPYEVFVSPGTESLDTAFDDLHSTLDDPWSVVDSWYERRKRAVTVAALPERHYGRVLEVGCSVGVLAHDLAGRCDELVALDRSEVAVEGARGRLRGVAHARVDQAVVPWDWPGGWFDLVVISEVGYFLSPLELAALVDQVRSSLRPTGHVVLCHWRHPVVGWPLDGDRVHARWASANRSGPLVEHVEADFVLEVYPHPDAPGADVEGGR